jgi:hypothetical protein
MSAPPVNFTAVDPNQVLVAATGLTASLVGALIAFWAQAWNWRRTRKAQAVDDEATAIQQLLVKALSLDMGAHQLALAAKTRGSLDGTVLAFVGGEGIINTHATIEAMNRDAEQLHVAVTRLWLTSDAATVNLAREVLEAAAGVIAAHTGRRQASLWARIHQLVTGPRLGDPQRIESARTVLAEKREKLVQHTRKRFDLQQLPTVARSE